MFLEVILNSTGGENCKFENKQLLERRFPSTIFFNIPSEYIDLECVSVLK